MAEVGNPTHQGYYWWRWDDQDSWQPVMVRAEQGTGRLVVDTFGNSYPRRIDMGAWGAEIVHAD